MPHLKSAKKRLRQRVKRTERNRDSHSAIKTELRKVRAIATAGDAQKFAAVLSEAYQVLDKAAVRGIIHRNTAGRMKSRLSRLLKAPTAAAKAPAAASKA